MHPLSALVFLLQTVGGLYIAILLLRLLFQLIRADFYNPVSQAIVRLTSPLVQPLRRVIPAVGRIDSASLLLAFGFQCALIAVIAAVLQEEPGIPMLLLWSMLSLIHLVLDIYQFSLFFIVVLSWVAPYSRHPVALLAYQLTEPLLKPVRHLLPPLGGLDFSVMVVLMLIYILDKYLVPGTPF